MTKKSFSRRGFMGSAAMGAAGVSFGSSSSAAAATAFDPVPLERPTSIWDLPTPALLVDEVALEHNLDKMTRFYRSKPAELRPHGKTHKCPIIANKQLERGAIGICSAKVSEAEVMVDAGIESVLITSPVVTPDKIARVVALAKRSLEVAVVVDQAHNVRDYGDAAGAAGVTLKLVVGLDMFGRTGIAMGQPAIDLVATIDKTPHVTFAGLQAYAGHLQHINGWETRNQQSVEAMTRAVETKAAIEKAGFPVPVLTGGGTGTYNMDSEVEGITDVQVGSYLFMDVNYRNIGGKTSAVYDDFRPSLLVLTTAISQPRAGRVTVDAGYKAVAADHEPPALYDIDGVSYGWGGDEHGILQFRNPSRRIEVGDKVLLIASHCDPTVNLYDHFHPYRDEKVTELWPIAARGRSQ